MSTQEFDRFELIAAVNHLVAEKEEGWLDAAKLVVIFAQSIPLHNPSGSFKTHVTGIDRSSQAEGYSPGVGNVNVKEETESAESSGTSESFARVGNYKIFRYRNGLLGLGMVSIRHYLDDGVSGFARMEWPQWSVVYEDDLIPQSLLYGTYKVITPRGYRPVSELILNAMLLWTALKASWKWKNLKPLISTLRGNQTYTQYRAYIVERVVYSTIFTTP